MKLLTLVFLFCASLANAGNFRFELNITINPNGGNAPVVNAPYTIDPHPTDETMALHAITMALLDRNQTYNYKWRNPYTGNSGNTRVIKTNGRHITFTVRRYVQGTFVSAETMVAVKGTAKYSNTWTINNQWIINSVDRTHANKRGCKVQFIDVKVTYQPRIHSTMHVCHNKHTRAWIVK